VYRHGTGSFKGHGAGADLGSGWRSQETRDQTRIDSRDDDGEKIVVRRAGRYSSQDIHRALFPQGPPKPHALDEMKAGIERDIRERPARR